MQPLDNFDQARFNTAEPTPDELSALPSPVELAASPELQTEVITRQSVIDFAHRRSAGEARDYHEPIKISARHHADHLALSVGAVPEIESLGTRQQDIIGEVFEIGNEAVTEDENVAVMDYSSPKLARGAVEDKTVDPFDFSAYRPNPQQLREEAERNKPILEEAKPLQPEAFAEVLEMTEDQAYEEVKRRAEQFDQLANKFNDPDATAESASAALAEIIAGLSAEKRTGYMVAFDDEKQLISGFTALVSELAIWDSDGSKGLDSERLRLLTEQGSLDGLRFQAMNTQISSVVTVGKLREIGKSTYGEPATWPNNPAFSEIPELQELFDKQINARDPGLDGVWRVEDFRHACIQSVETNVHGEPVESSINRLQDTLDSVFRDNLGLSDKLVDSMIAAINVRQTSSLARQKAEGLDTIVLSDKWIADSIKCLDRVSDTKRAETLFKDFGIVNFDRCSPGLLEQMYKLSKGDEETVRKLQTGDLTLIVEDALGDHNGAMRDGGMAYEKASDNKNLVYFEAHHPNDFYRSVARLSQRWDIKASTMIVTAHGHAGFFAVGGKDKYAVASTPSEIDKVEGLDINGGVYDINQSNVGRMVSRFMKVGEDGKKHLVFVSCSLAQNPDEHKPSFVKTMAELTGAVTWGAEQPINIDLTEENGRSKLQYRSGILNSEPVTALRFEKVADEPITPTRHVAIK